MFVSLSIVEQMMNTLNLITGLRSFETFLVRLINKFEILVWQYVWLSSICTGLSLTKLIIVLPVHVDAHHSENISNNKLNITLFINMTMV